MSCQRILGSLVLSSTVYCIPVVAVEVEWSHTELQALQGRHFELGAAQRSLLTLEHADVWTYGVNFGFFLSFPSSTWERRLDRVAVSFID